MEVVDFEDLLCDAGQGGEKCIREEFAIGREDDLGFRKGVSSGATGKVQHHPRYSVSNAYRLPELGCCSLFLGRLVWAREGSYGACGARKTEEFREGDDAAEEEPDFLDPSADELSIISQSRGIGTSRTCWAGLTFSRIVALLRCLQ